MFLLITLITAAALLPKKGRTSNNSYNESSLIDVLNTVIDTQKVEKNVIVRRSMHV